jgi:hypothetical protein
VPNGPAETGTPFRKSANWFGSMTETIQLTFQIPVVAMTIDVVPGVGATSPLSAPAR